MGGCDAAVSRADYESCLPSLEADAARIMAPLAGMSADDLATAVKLSLPMARRLQRMIYDFPDKSTGGKAIESYTGVVFKAFGYGDLDASERRVAERDIRIISSLYGWLRPDDIIKPYRFDFTTRLAPDGQTFAAYWRQRVTDCLLHEVAAQGHGDVLDLLPLDAARCLDRRRIAGAARIWKADFREIVSGDRTRTPNAGKLKVLRGRLLRHIVTHRLQSPRELLGVDDDDFMADGIDEAAGTITFTTVAD